MENEIRKTIKILKLQYLLFWVLPVLLVVVYESGGLAVGIYADDPGGQYVWETMGILAAIILVPSSLKLFSLVLKKKIGQSAFPVALSQYKNISCLRLALLETVVLLNVVVYYLTLDNMGLLCALIGLTASLFCIPGGKQVKEELNILPEADE